MRVINLSDNASELNRFVAELRDISIQGDPLRFRKNIERIGQVMGYEISKSFDFSAKNVTTPLGVASVELAENEVVLGTILRAGLPFHYGFLNFFDRSENAFVSAYRKYKDALKFDIAIEYIASPNLTGKTLIVTDPMLATGSSMELAYKAMLTKGVPGTIHFASIIASQQAVDYLKKIFPDDNITLWLAAVDPELNEHAYIIPGLGDAGDLAFGEKI